MANLLRRILGRRATPVVTEAQPLQREREAIDLLVIAVSETFTLAEVSAPIGRITDWLNSNDPIRGRRVAAASERGEVWMNLDRSQCLVVVPPLAATDPKLRLHRPKQRILVRLGGMTVTGAAHAPSGTEATAFLRRHAKAFVPLTEVSIGSPRDGGQSAKVAIVHLALADSFEPASDAADRFRDTFGET